jgi:hypothetical protein
MWVLAAGEAEFENEYPGGYVHDTLCFSVARRPKSVPLKAKNRL